MTTGTGIGIVGCGFVSEYYLRTLPGHPELQLIGVTDLAHERAAAVASRHGVEHHETVDALLADERVAIVLNLTDPRSHHDISRAALLAGKHVYTEKPLATELDRATELVELAEARGLEISSAPCSLLGETAQTLWRAIRDGAVGPVRVVYAEMDEGLVHRMPFRSWTNGAGVPWPFRDEFELGTVVEHAGYVVTWLPAFFGSAESVTGIADCLLPDKAGVPTDGTDFSVAVVRFASGVVARVTCSLIAPHDHSIRVIGDRGVLSTDDTWFYDSRVHLRRSINVGPRHQWLPRRRRRLLGTPQRYRYRGAQQMDFARGVADLADAIGAGHPPRLSARYCLHTTELVLALDRGLREGCSYTMTTAAGPVDPMPWAR